MLHRMNTPSTARAPAWLTYTPKAWTQLRDGYAFDTLRRDAVAGLTVAIVALPLAMAIAIASGATPAQGLHTAIIAGFLISALGGSKVQIGGPTGAFIPVVFAVIARHGYDGLVLATLIAGLILIVAGLMRVGALLKYMPQPLITGFTAGIAVIIASSQLKDFLGLDVDTVPAEFVEKIQVLGGALGTISSATVLLGLACLAFLILQRRYAPKLPGFLLVVVAASLLVALGGLSTDTIGSRFGGIDSSLPVFALPAWNWAKIVAVLPDAFTIAFLAGIESLLSAVVADGMIGSRHRSNAELIGQGVANCASALFGGLPATGAIARTATNVRAGARTPVAGMLHALFLLAFMLLLAPLMAYVPLAALAAVLLIVAWNMAELDRFAELLRSPRGDRAVLLTTFLLTVLVDLTIAIEVGMVMAAFLFMHRMARVVEVETNLKLVEAAEDELAPEPGKDQRLALPAGVEVYQINGPLFFGVADRLEDVANQLFVPPKVFILRMRLVPLIDASGVHALERFAEKLHKRGTLLILSGLQPGPGRVLARMGFTERPGRVRFVADFAAALALTTTPVPEP